MKENITTYILCGFFVALSVFVQAQGYLNTDSSWLLDSARKLLNGQNLYTEYTETNPPFIVYFNVIPAFLAENFGLSLTCAYKIVVFTILLICALITCEIVKSNFVRIIIFYALFLLPVQSFGQREHLFVAMLLPYFFCLYEGYKAKLPIILLALVGFLIKPYFVVFFIGFALWQWLVLQRSLFLKENFIIGFGLVFYVLLIFLLEPDYISNPLPLLTKYYSEFFYKKAGFLQIAMVVVLMPITAICFNKNNAIFNRKIAFAIFAAFLGGATYLLQNKGWTNHYLPFYFFITISLGLIIENSTKLIQIVLGLCLTGIIAHSAAANFIEICPNNRSDSEQIIEVLNKYASGKEVLGISTNLDLLYPEILYSNAKFNWQYPQLWMFMGMYEKQDVKNKKIIHHTPAKQSADEAKIFHSMINYIITKKPAVIMIYDAKVETKKLGEFTFGYIEYFSQNPSFAASFKNYHKVKQINGKQIYVLDANPAATNIGK